MNRRQALFGLAGLAAAPLIGGARQVQDTGDLWARIRAMGEAIIAEGLTPGLQISVRQGAEVVFQQGFGQANVETATPMTASSVLRIGSLTKQFTAATLLLLEAEGRLSLTDPLSRFLPDFPRAADLTLERMLDHTSGLGNYTDAASLNTFLQAGRPDRSMAEMVEIMKASPGLQAFEPGTGWAYSNTAYVLLGAVIEKASERRYDVAMKERLFTPLGLNDTAVDDASQIVAQRGSGYTPTLAPGVFQNASFISMSYPGAAGSMRSTTTDLCRWHQALLGGKVLSAAALARMLTPATLADGSLPMQGGSPIRYGLGLSIGEAAGRSLISHSGGIQGFSAYLGSYPDNGLTVATIVNVDGGPAGARVQAMRVAIRDGLLS
ncbi:beta-lactamase family protein [Brevundimonas vitis]|uniref:Beta-lactamase family protein n=1 Tax=Brevundimonas vitisensis TaxID=2800818 RepID=A0ABX7BK58_9CAUL|nr:serine hydrolase domain-containing protein [Brevundimonas vitisensis]QQQ17945.1 beta-lactamase family protein [Brevundimonas vitisensis]